MRWQTGSSLEVPETREMIQAAQEYVAGNLHFSHFLSRVQDCHYWAKVHNAHPELLKLTESWLRIGRHVWPEIAGIEKWPESKLLERVKADLASDPA